MYEEELMAAAREEAEAEIILKLLESMSPATVADLLHVSLERVEVIAKNSSLWVPDSNMRWKLVDPADLEEISEEAFEGAKHRGLDEAHKDWYKTLYKESFLEAWELVITELWRSGERKDQHFAIVLLLDCMTVDEISSYLRIPLAEVEALMDN